MKNGSFSFFVNVGFLINSFVNDNYYFSVGDLVFVFSNCFGVFYVKNLICCSDIFVFVELVREVFVIKKEILVDLNKWFLVIFYFYNDVFGLCIYEFFIGVNYFDSYNDYLCMIFEYWKEYVKGLNGECVMDVEEDIENFFM